MSGLSLRDLAARLGLKHHGDFSLFESGKRVMPAKHVRPLAELYGVDAEELRALQRAAAEEVRIARAARAAGLSTEVGGPVANVDARDRTPLFVGREQTLTDLAAYFSESSPAGATCALVGMPGVGKSQLALHFAHRHFADYDLVWRLQATEPATLPFQLVRLAPLLGAEADEPGPLETAEAVIEVLARRNRWLLIVDDARTADDVRSLCVTDRGGHILITSRNAGWRSLGREFVVEPLDLDQSKQFLLERTGNRGDSTGIAEALGGLPLALEQAGSLIESRGLPFADYLSFLSERPVEALARGKPAYASAGVHQTLHNAIAEAISDDRQAEAILRHAALLADTPIPIGLLPDGPDRQLSTALALLARRSLVSVADDTVSVHQLIQMAAREQLDEAEADVVLEGLAARLVGLLPSGIESGTDVARFSMLLPHVVALAKGDHADASLGICLSRCGAALDAAGQREQAESLLRRAALMFRELRRDELLADALHNLAGICDEVGRPLEAIELLEESLELRERITPRDELKIAGTKGMLGQALCDVDHGRGEGLLRQAIDDLTAVVGNDHPYVLVTLGNLSVAVEARGEHREATQLRLDALARAETSLGYEHPVTAGALVNLALSADPELDAAERRRWCERALAVRAALMIEDETQAELADMLAELDSSVG